MKKKFIPLLALCAMTAVYATSTFSQTTTAQALGWQTGSSPDHQKSAACDGYFEQSTRITTVAHPSSYKKTPIKVTAKGPVLFRTNGESVLQKDVEVTQPGRLLRADKAIVQRDAATGKITKITLIGHVRAEESGKLLIGDKAIYDLEKNSITLYNAAYRITGKQQLTSLQIPFSAWGTAKIAQRLPNQVLELTDASYSTCAPINTAWKISAKHIRLDQKHNEGSAQNAVMHFQHIPILWSPRYSFGLNGTRKSGFLAPKMGYATDHGFYASLPYYWDMASNYDVLLTPTWYDKRSLQGTGLFRYLTYHSNGNLYASFIPNDDKFTSFQQNTLNSFDGKSIDAQLTPYLSDLRGYNNNRTFIEFQNDTWINSRWKAMTELRYITDPYFPRDFDSEFLDDNTNQLPSFSELTYNGLHWNDVFLLQTYQTLHPLDQFKNPAQNQYTRLPELDFNAAYPRALPHTNIDFSGQAVYFDYRSNYFPFTYERPIGERIHLRPGISRPFNWGAGFFTPKLYLDSTNYFTKLPTANALTPREDFDVNRTTPIFDIDSGLYFDRQMHLRHHDYIQTLEPRIFYLYTPYLNQDRYPNFDTQALPFSFSNLYTINAFTGFDRIQNSDQLSLGVTSNILDTANAGNLLSASMGLITYFENPHVCLLKGCQIISQSISPLAGSLSFNPNPMWSFTSQIAWDTARKQINNTENGVEFHLDNQRIVVLDYAFTHANPDTPFDSLGFSSDSSLIKTGLIWPLTHRWQFFGYIYYDLSRERPEDEYIGLSYQTCCWGLRFIIRNSYDGTEQVNGGSVFQNRYTTNYFVEFSLTGLGSAGNSRAESLLTSTLPGYEDMFSRDSQYNYAEKY